MRLKRTLILAALLSCACGQPMACGQSLSEQGILKFKEGKYREAVDLFEQACEQYPAGENLYNVASAAYNAGMTGKACDYLNRAISEFPEHPKVGEWKKLLAEIRAGRAQRADGQEPNRGPSQKYNASGGGGATTAGASRAAERNRLMDNLIKVVRPVAGHPSVSPLFMSEARTAVSHIPDKVLESLIARNIKIYLTPTLIDKNPELKNREGRGYDGHTYKSCPGMFDGNVVLCEYTVDEDNDSITKPIDRDHYRDTTYHEIGHALDWAQGNISETTDFKHSYRLDAAQVPADQREQIAYFLQKAEAGQQECCAELIGAILGADSSRNKQVVACFPRTVGLLKKRLGI